MNLNLTKSDNPRFQQAISFLEKQIDSGIKLGLESTRNLLDVLGNPHHDMRFVHVAGTNGKGSVCCMLAGALKRCGLRVGFFSSPHLVNVRERYRVDLDAISEDEFAELVEELQEKAGHLFCGEDSPSFFEATTVLGLMYFRKRNCDLAVVEVGMGGRLDATNVIAPILSVITRIDFDHVGALGDTLHAIAGEKAGILKPDVPAVVAPQREEALARIREVAEEVGSELTVGGIDFAPNGYTPLPPDLLQRNHVEYKGESIDVDTRLIGPHQAENVAVAVAALYQLHELGILSSVEPAIQGICDVRWPARLDQLPDGVMVDGAHNVAGVKMLAEALKTYFPERRWQIVFGALNTKDWRRMLDLIIPFCAGMVVVPIEHKFGVPAAELAAYLEQAHPAIPVKVADDAIQGLRQIQQTGDGLVIGSLYMAGEVLSTYTNGQPVSIEVNE